MSRDISLDSLTKYGVKPYRSGPRAAERGEALRHSGVRGVNRDADSLIYEDQYPSLEEDPERRLLWVLDGLLSDLTVDQRDAVNAVVVGGYSYREAAKLLGWYEGVKKRRPNGKRAWRECEAGLTALREACDESWVREILGEHL